MGAERYLLVVADDYGIGPATSEGILDLAQQGLVTATVLLVNSPFAEQAVGQWRKSGLSLEIGWHPCLNLDRPILPPDRIPSLVTADGQFLTLGRFIPRMLAGLLRAEEIRAELLAQYRRFQELIGHPPTFVNAHKHLHAFGSVGMVLREILARQDPLPYIRRVREPWRTFYRVPGGRVKRIILSASGSRQAIRQARSGFPGNDWLAGITDAHCVADPDFLCRWLKYIPGKVVELTCHPGYRDPTLAPRDCPVYELDRRPREMELLRAPSFLAACGEAGFRLVSPSELAKRRFGAAISAA
jgi:predicted glycoside hydrolase/deacetylase ChbG (UPF0249 family)